MRLIRHPYDDCDAARELASLALDGELSELGATRLEGHLERCSECRAFQARSAAITGELRTILPEAPEFKIVLPRRRVFPVRALQAGAAAAAVALLAVLGASPTLHGSSTSGPAFASSAAFADRGDELVPNLHRPPAKPVGSQRIAV